MTGCVRVVLGVALAWTLGACTKTAEAPTHDPVADRAAIDAVRNREMSALNAGDTAAMVAVYTDDILLMPNHAPAVSGSAAVRAWYDESLSQVTITGRHTSTSVDVSGDLAVDHYAGELTVTFKAPDAKPLTEPMKGIHVYRRQADGSWKISMNIWNGDEGPAEPSSR